MDSLMAPVGSTYVSRQVRSGQVSLHGQMAALCLGASNFIQKETLPARNEGHELWFETMPGFSLSTNTHILDPDTALPNGPAVFPASDRTHYLLVGVAIQKCTKDCSPSCSRPVDMTWPWPYQVRQFTIPRGFCDVGKQPAGHEHTLKKIRARCLSKNFEPKWLRTSLWWDQVVHNRASRGLHDVVCCKYGGVIGWKIGCLRFELEHFHDQNFDN